jgi:hypothetical protein
MIRAPRLPMSLAALPRQQLVEVIDLPVWPEQVEITVCLFWRPKEILPRHQPRHMVYLGAVEWAWRPFSSRVDAYYLHRGRRHWIVYIRDPDPDEVEHEWTVAAYAPRHGVTAEKAAVHLVAARWRTEAEERDLDRFHFVAEEGALRVADWRAMAREVWDDAG